MFWIIFIIIYIALGSIVTFIAMKTMNGGDWLENPELFILSIVVFPYVLATLIYEKIKKPPHSGGWI